MDNTRNARRYRRTNRRLEYLPAALDTSAKDSDPWPLYVGAASRGGHSFNTQGHEHIAIQQWLKAVTRASTQGGCSALPINTTTRWSDWPTTKKQKSLTGESHDKLAEIQDSRGIFRSHTRSFCLFVCFLKLYSNLLFSLLQKTKKKRSSS